MSEVYSTADIWLGGLLLAETDAELIDVHQSRNGRETVTFTFRGRNLSKMAQAYCREEALGNVTQIRIKINELRDLIFQHRR